MDSTGYTRSTESHADKSLGGILWSGSTEPRKTTKQVGKAQHKGPVAKHTGALRDKEVMQTQSFTERQREGLRGTQAWTYDATLIQASKLHLRSS